MGFSVKELKYKTKYLIYLAEEQHTGTWFSFKIRLKGQKFPILFHNVEPTPIFRLVNSKKGTTINRITLDFDIKRYLLKNYEFSDELDDLKDSLGTRLYIDIFKYSESPYLIAYFTLKNISDYELLDFSMYFIFDFDINGLQGFDTDVSDYDEDEDILYQYDNTGVHGGLSSISKPTHYETTLTNEFNLDKDHLILSNSLVKEPGEILSALQIKFQDLSPNQSFQTAIILSGGLSKEELFENIKKGKNNAIRYAKQVNRSIKSEERNSQEKAFEDLNKKESKGCD
ncbi:MAG: hypothetical protein R6U96_02725 [Promethearchaeia archaeon]